MRTGLLFRDRDLDLDALPRPPDGLAADLGLERLFAAMADGDPLILDVVRRVVPAGLDAVGAIHYRQAVLRDAFLAPAATRELFRIAGHAVETERSVWGAALRSPELALRRSVEVVGALLADLRAVRDVVERDGASFRSEGLTAFAARIRTDVDDAFLAQARALLERLEEPTVIATARLGDGHRGTEYVLRRLPDGARRLRDRVVSQDRRGLVVEVTLRDQNALNALGELRAQALASAGMAVSDAAAGVLGLFRRLRVELAFVVGCLNLHEAFAGAGVATCFPEPIDGDGRRFAARGLVEPGLALTPGRPVVGNDVDADGRGIVILTGANGGGKSTFLRAVGLAQVMLQAGMPVAATSLRATLRANVLTHFTREEEAGLDAGRLDAELARLSKLVDDARPGSLVLLNESFSSTNERDGSLIAEQVVTALADGGATVWYVTHLHDLARRLHAAGPGSTLFLRAERGTDGRRPFRLVEAPPLATSFGRDVYDRVVGRRSNAGGTPADTGSTGPG